MDTVIPSERANAVHVMKMCAALQKVGFDVTLHCDAAQPPVDAQTVFRRYGVQTPFALKQIALPAAVRRHGHRFAVMYSALLKTKNRGDGIAYGRSAYALYALRNKQPFFFEAHAEPTGLNYRLERALLRSENCMGLIVISAMLKRKYRELFPFFPEAKITVLHDGADRAEPCAPAKLQGTEGVKIGYLGSLYPGKCMETLIPLACACPELTFHVVGGTPEWVARRKAEADGAGAKNLIFYGQVDNAEVGSYYEAFDVCLMPFSKNIFVDQRKSFDIGNWISPLKLFEAMAHGKAILVSRLPSIEEVITDSEQCVFAEPDDIADWAQKLRALAADEATRSRLGQAAKKELEERYTWETRAETLLRMIPKRETQ